MSGPFMKTVSLEFALFFFFWNPSSRFKGCTYARAKGSQGELGIWN